jgi:hypothetical protein
MLFVLQLTFILDYSVSCNLSPAGTVIYYRKLGSWAGQPELVYHRVAHFIFQQASASGKQPVCCRNHRHPESLLRIPFALRKVCIRLSQTLQPRQPVPRLLQAIASKQALLLLVSDFLQDTVCEDPCNFTAQKRHNSNTKVIR